MLGIDAKDDRDVSSNPLHILESHYLPYRMRCISDIHLRDKQFSANSPTSVKDPSSNKPREVSMRTALPFFQMWYVSLGQSPLTNGTIHKRGTHNVSICRQRVQARGGWAVRFLLLFFVSILTPALEFPNRFVPTHSFDKAQREMVSGARQ